MTKYTTYALSLVVLILAVALFVRGGEVVTALIINTTNTTIATVNISNAPPICENVNCYDEDGNLITYTGGVQLVGGGKRYVKCNYTCNDNNGWGDIKNYSGSFGHWSHTEPRCPVNGASGFETAACYINTSCQNTSAKNVTAQYATCTFGLWFNFANGSTTIGAPYPAFGNVSAGDYTGTIDTEYKNITVATLLAMGVDSALAFGSRSASANDSLQTTTMQMYNYGNIWIDVQVNGSTLQCTQGSMSAGYVHLNRTANSWYNQSYPLNATLCGSNASYGATCGRFAQGLIWNMTRTATVTPIPTNFTVYAGVGVPSGVNGNCQGTIWFVALDTAVNIG